MPHRAAHISGWGRYVPERVMTQVLAQAGLSLDDIDYIIPHQANLRIIEAVARRLQVTTGSRLMLLSFGAGLTWSAALVEWTA